MTLVLLLHRPTSARYIALIADGVVLQAAGQTWTLQLSITLS